MRAVIAIMMLALTVLGGCAEQTPEATETVDDHDHGGHMHHEEEMPALPGQLMLSFDDVSYPAGTFNGTLEYLADESVNLTAMTWTVTFTQAGAEIADDNATADSHDNATAAPEGNATGNETVIAPSDHGAFTVEGVGLPAIVEANLTELGNYTVTGFADFNGSRAQLLENVIEIIAGEPVVLDPCAGAPVQETITASGTTGPGAVGEGTGTSHVFELMPCQHKMTIAVSTTTADVIIRLHKPDGSTQDYDADFVGGDTMVYETGEVLEVGEYNAEIRHYATAYDMYDLTITFE